MTFGIVLYDQDRRIVAIDEAAAAVFGEPAQGLVGRQITDFVPQPDRALLAEARATLERLGEASGQYALDRADGSRTSIVYRVLANAPIARVNLMAIGPSEAAAGTDVGRIRRVNGEVHVGLDLSEDDRWFGQGLRVPGSARSALGGQAGTVFAAVFPTEQDAWAALLASQPKVEEPLEIALSSFDGGWPRDPRSVLAVRGADGHFDTITAIVAQFGGTLMAGAWTRT
jgi:hypothetical protein